MIGKALRRFEAWGEPAYWWGRAGLEAHPLFTAFVVGSAVFLVPVFITGGTLVVLTLAGPLQALRWSLKAWRAYPLIVLDTITGRY